MRTSLLIAARSEYRVELLKFANQLQETGQIRLSAEPSPPPTAAQALKALGPHVKQLDEAERMRSLSGLPPLSLSPAVWAMTMLYEACRCLVFRELDEAAVRRRLGVPCPQGMSASTAYSVDFAFRHLPGLLDLARGLSEDDYLVTRLRSLARAWPLSSVGAARIGPVDCSGFIGNNALRQMYVDRIIDTRDTSRLAEPGVLAAVREAAGMHGQTLCSWLMDHIGGRGRSDARAVDAHLEEQLKQASRH